MQEMPWMCHIENRKWKRNESLFTGIDEYNLSRTVC